jgi:UDP-N-acetylglucosamine 2-epimerase
VRIFVDRDYEGVPAPGGDSATGLICTALVAFEDEFEASEPEAVVVADDSELALAAALVATKLLIPLEATAEAITAESPNGRVLAQLATQAS